MYFAPVIIVVFSVFHRCIRRSLHALLLERCVSFLIVFTCRPLVLFCLCRGAELWPNQQRRAWRMAFSLIQPAGEGDIQSDNWGIDRPGVSGDIDKCGTEGLVSDGEDGCQRENRSTSIRSSTLHCPLFFLSFLSLAFLLSFPSLRFPYCFHPVQFTPLLVGKQLSTTEPRLTD